MERLKHLKECLTSVAETQASNLAQVDTKEYGELIDMIKDLSEAIYYCSKAKYIDEKEEHYNSPSRYYTEKVPDPWHQRREPYYREDPNMGRNGKYRDIDYTERELPMERDHREGRSPRSRKMYMEAKEKKYDKNTQMHELECYMQELTQDLVEMIEDASPEEKQYLEKRLSILSSKVAQMNDKN